MKFKELLFEVYDIKKMVNSVELDLKEYGIVGKFKHKGNIYSVQMEKNPLLGKGAMEFSFRVKWPEKTKKGSYELTNLYEQNIVLPTVFWILKEYVKKYSPPHIGYSVDNLKRDVVYERFINKIGYHKIKKIRSKIKKNIYIFVYSKDNLD